MSPLGHFSMGFVAKKFALDVHTIFLLIASWAVDILYFFLRGLEHHLIMQPLWMLLAGFIVFTFTKSIQNSLVVTLVVFSHWVLDFLVWDNIPIAFKGSKEIGLGLYTRLGFSVENAGFNKTTILITLIEILMLSVGIVFYIHTKKRQNASKKSI